MIEIIDTEKARDMIFNLISQEHRVSLLQSECDDIIHRVLECLKAQWQPIETAPKDGTRFLACFRNIVFETRFDINSNVFDANRYGDIAIYNATHWMPLPQPPED